MEYNQEGNHHGNILFGIERNLRLFETTSRVADELAGMISLAKDLSREYGIIPMERVLSFEQRYKSIKSLYERKSPVPFRFPIEGPKLREVIDCLHCQVQH